MDNNKTLQVVIKAVDDASAQLDAIRNKAAQLASQFGDNSDGLKKYLADEQAAAGGNESMTASVFKGMAAWDMLKESLAVVRDFLEGAIASSAKASETMAIVQTNVENAGYSWASLQPQLQAYSEKMLQLGFDHEDTAKSVSKLLLITHDYNQSLALNSLAMDLARNRGISLEQATTSLAQVLQGAGGKALMQYGLTFKDGASSAEILVQLQDKLKNSAVNFADSAGGKLEVLNTKWEDIKKQIGDELLPTVISLVDELEKELPNIISFVETTAAVFTDVYDGVKTVVEVSAQLPIVGFYLDSITEIAKALIEDFQSIVDGIRMVTGTTDAYAASQTKLSDSMKNVIGAWNEHHKNAQITEDDFKQMSSNEQVAIINNVRHSQTQSQFNDTLKGTSSAAKDTVSALASIDGKTGTTATSIEKLKDQYKTMSDSAVADLTDLATTHASKMASIADSIAKVQKSITDLTNSYNQTQSNDTESVADKIVASQNKVADLKKQIAAATTQTEKDNLNQQLTDEQKNLASSADFQKNNVAAITEAQRRAGLTDLQRTIEDYNQKRILAAQDYQEKLTALNNELAAKQQEKLSEITLYTQKNAEIVAIMVTANKDFTKYSNDRIATTKAEVDTEIAYYQELQKAISAVKSATSIGSIANTNNAKVSGARASGGDVNSNEAYLVGEKGAEIFVPSSAGSIIPNDKIGSGGGKNINININGAVMSQDAARVLGDLIIRNLQRVARV